MSEAQRLAAIIRAKDPMVGLCNEKLITTEACDWLKSALDPFHDFQLDHVKGYPDISTEPSVVVKIQQSATISAPPGLAEGANWDCHLVTSPVDYSKSKRAGPTMFMSVVLPNGNLAGSPPGLHIFENETSPGVGQVGRMDGLVINSVPSAGINGEQLTFTPGHCRENASGGYQVQNIALDDFFDYEDTDLGVYRLVYSGFEVVNTTAQINKQGAVTVYEYGNSFEVAAGVSNVTSSDNGAAQPVTYFRMPPNNIAEAKIMPGAHSWAAQDGSYNTAKFQTDNPFQSISRRNFSLCQNQATAPANGGFGAYNIRGSMSTAGIAVTPGVYPMGEAVPATHFSRMNTTGAYYTGLSPQTTLFVTWRVGIERLPSANKPTFLALATPSATFDPSALVLYSMVAAALPPGCPQGYNDAGKWFRWITDKAREAIPKVYPLVRAAALMATSLGRPLIGTALGGLGEALRPIAENAAARTLQRAARNGQSRGNQKGPKRAVLNFAQPQNSGRGKGNRVQGFGQMQ